LAIVASAPGTPALRAPTYNSREGRGLPSAPRNQSGPAAFGAVSRPSMVVNAPVLPSLATKNMPPPMPEFCGSTTLSASMVAIAASVALPPWRRISTPAEAARGSAALTMP
jgi:hypothetical protein